MKKIDTLIRLHKFELDEKRRALKSLEDMMAHMIQTRMHLDQELIEEQKTAAQGIELGLTYHHYAQNFISRREKLEQDMAELRTEIAKAEIILQMAYQELKKYEITAERQEKEEKYQDERKSQGLLDDAGMQGFVRKNKS